MPNRLLRSVAVVAAVLSLSFAAACAGAGRAAGTRPADLVVLLVVDQLGSEYLERYGPELTGGFRTLIDRGILYPNAMHAHAITETAPGHATLATGRDPRSHGIVSNEIGVLDPDYPLVGNVGDPASPRRLRGTTLYDWILDRNPRALGIGVSRKDRGSLLLVGRKGEAVWFAGGRFTTSTFYRNTVPSWAQMINSEIDAASFAGRAWTLSAPAGQYREPDSVWYENGGVNMVFPHRMADEPERAVRQLERFPWMDSVTLAVALQAVRARQLGHRGTTDYLGLSVSTTDAVGHSFGADSREMHDHILKLDQWLGQFLDSLAAIVPPSRTIIALSSDHGIAFHPERYQARGEPGDRIDVRDALDPLVRMIAGRTKVERPVLFDNGLVITDLAALRSAGMSVDSVAADAAARLMTVRGVRRVFTPRSLAAAPVDDPDAQLWRRNLPPGFPWIAAALTERNHAFSARSIAEHGTVQVETQRVPMLFVIPGRAPAVHTRRVETVDMAPTVAALLGIRPLERVDGVVLPEVVPPR